MVFRAQPQVYDGKVVEMQCVGHDAEDAAGDLIFGYDRASCVAGRPITVDGTAYTAATNPNNRRQEFLDVPSASPYENNLERKVSPIGVLGMYDESTGTTLAYTHEQTPGNVNEYGMRTASADNGVTTVVFHADRAGHRITATYDRAIYDAPVDELTVASAAGYAVVEIIDSMVPRRQRRRTRGVSGSCAAHG